jgi:hypothetical protein
MLETKFGLSAEEAERIAGAMGTAAANGKKLFWIRLKLNLIYLQRLLI